MKKQREQKESYLLNHLLSNDINETKKISKGLEMNQSQSQFNNRRKTDFIKENKKSLNYQSIQTRQKVGLLERPKQNMNQTSTQNRTRLMSQQNKKTNQTANKVYRNKLAENPMQMTCDSQVLREVTINQQQNQRKKKQLQNSKSNHMINPKETNQIYNVQYLSKNTKIKKTTSNNASNTSNNQVIQKEQKEVIYLTDDEKAKFSCKGFISGFEKLELIGKGGFALVWLGQSKNNKYAVKQLIRNQNEQQLMNELQFYQNTQKENDQQTGIIRLERFEVQNNHIWMAFELGQQTLSKALFKMKGQFYKGERVYQIINSNMQIQMIKDINLLKLFIRRIAESLRFLKANKIIHCDLKLENLLIMEKSEKLEEMISQMKIIDFGSCIQLQDSQNNPNLNITTPEYMPPELLEFINKPQSKRQINNVENQLNSIYREEENFYKIDVWSLGAILLEIVSGIPMWISYKCMVNRKGKDVLDYGLFSNINRSFDKIIIKQKQFSSNPIEKVKLYLDLSKEQNQCFVDLLIGMLQFNHQERLTIDQVLCHPFIQE